MRYFGRRYRCIAYNARGYPPSDVPDEVERYSQDRARDDIRAVLDALKIDKAHIVGLSMGGFATLHFGFTYPHRALSLVVAGCGYGASPEQARSSSPRRPRPSPSGFETRAWPRPPRPMRSAPTRVQFQNKDPRGCASSPISWRSTRRPARRYTMRGVQKRAAVAVRPRRQDEDHHGADAGHDRRRGLALPRAGAADEADDPDRRRWSVMPNTGHTINLEEPAAFNQHIADFLVPVDAGRWRPRDPRAMATSILGK